MDTLGLRIIRILSGLGSLITALIFFFAAWFTSGWHSVSNGYSAEEAARAQSQANFLVIAGIVLIATFFLLLRAKFFKKTLIIVLIILAIILVVYIISTPQANIFDETIFPLVCYFLIYSVFYYIYRKIENGLKIRP